MARLRPVRAGIVNLWDYTDHQFAFHGGRLVLRGPNGSGKTKALELLFPFLLDGSLSPQRLDPFSGTGRTMRDNLLYRPDRETVIGYAWMELADGEGTTWVLGAGLRGQKARSDVKSWFFVTDRPYGDGWSVLDESDQPLTESRLAAVLGASAVFDAATRYRERVDQVLFGGIGADRYAALIQLVLFLRRPQLAKDLDLARLSDTLSAGLRPVDDDKLVDAAASFDDLETVQRDLERIERACNAVDTFLRSYRPYVRVVARQRTDAVQDAQREERAAERAIVASRQRVELAGQENEHAQQRLRDTEAEGARLRSERETQLRSEAYKSIGQLEDLRRSVGTAKRLATEAAAEAERFTERLTDSRSRADSAHEAMERAAATTAKAFDALRSDATRIVPHRIAEIDALEHAEDPTPPATAVLRERSEDHRAVRRLREAADRAAREADRADRELADAGAALERAQQSLDDAEATVLRSRDELMAAITAWAQQWSWVESSAVDALRNMARDGEPPALKQVAWQASAAARQSVADGLAALDQTERSERERLAGLALELQRVEAEHDDAPPAPPVRRRNRASATGAPLWRLVDFAPGLGESDKAGIEAALMGAGLLDAWVAPDGLATDGAELEAFLTPVTRADGSHDEAHGSGAPVTLADLLVPDPDATDATDGAKEHVPATVVLSVLRSIGLGRSGISVDASGGFVLGLLVGRTAKDRAEYIGSSARTARRRRRAAELRAQIMTVEVSLAALQAERDRDRARLADLDASIAELPSEAAVADALRRADGDARVVRERRADVERRAGDAEEGAARRRSSLDALTSAAHERSMPHDADGLDAFANALRSFERGVEELRRSHDRRQHAAATLATARSALQRAEDDARRSRDVSTERHAEASRSEADYNTLFDSVGADAQLVQATLQHLDGELRSNAAALTAGQAQAQSALAAHTKAVADAERAVDDHARSRLRVADSLERLKVLRRPELRSALGIDDTDDLAAFVPVLASACKDTVATDEQRQSRKTAVRHAFQTLEGQLGARYFAVLDDADDIDVVMITDDDGRAGVAAFAERITRKRDEQRLLLSAQERQVLEDTLVDSLCRQLFQRLRDAEEQVQRMNVALSGRRTTSGTGVQLSWTANDAVSNDQRTMAKLLERDPGLMGAEDRAALREALAAEIKRTRAIDGRSSYYDVLSKVLDYRAWRTFGIRVVERDGTTSALTKRVFNTKSGGEKATILHLPLFAAAAAHFDAAAPWAPRLVALDEAFAGIDAGTTRELLALTVQFDLDVFLTGHDFWGTVAEVPQLSVVTLSHHRDSHTVAALNGRWDGTVLSFDE